MDSGNHNCAVLFHARSLQLLLVWLFLVGVTCLLVLMPNAALGASIKLLPSVKTGCKGPYLKLAAGGNQTRSNIHMACTDSHDRMVYVRYSPRHGIVERSRVPGPKLSEVWRVASFNNPVYDIAHSNGRTYIAWIAQATSSRNYVYVAERKISGKWRHHWFRSLMNPFQVSLAADANGAYVAWSDGACDEYRPCDPENVNLGTVTDKGNQVVKIDPGPSPCTNDFLNTETFDPSVVATDDGPVVAVTDTCDASGSKISIHSVVGSVSHRFDSPPTVNECGQGNGRLTNTPEGLFIVYACSTSGPAGVNFINRLIFSVSTNSVWSQPSVITIKNGYLIGVSALVADLVLTGYGDGIAEQAGTSWHRIASSSSKYYESQMITAGHRLYIPMRASRLGRAVIRP